MLDQMQSIDKFERIESQYSNDMSPRKLVSHLSQRQNTDMPLRNKQPEQSTREQIDEPPAKSYAIDFNDFSGQKSQRTYVNDHHGHKFEPNFNQ